MLSLPMSTGSKVIGALNLYSRDADVFSTEEVSIAEVVTAHADVASRVAATLFGHKELAAELRTALESRAAIEQAKGIIMATTRCDADTAFRTLVQQSQHENRKLRDIALELVTRYRSG
jgi:AmiR/NasT family two-component response regulator